MSSAHESRECEGEATIVEAFDTTGANTYIYAIYVNESARS